MFLSMNNFLNVYKIIEQVLRIDGWSDNLFSVDVAAKTDHDEVM